MEWGGPKLQHEPKRGAHGRGTERASDADDRLRSRRCGQRRRRRPLRTVLLRMVHVKREFPVGGAEALAILVVCDLTPKHEDEPLVVLPPPCRATRWR